MLWLRPMNGRFEGGKVREREKNTGQKTSLNESSLGRKSWIRGGGNKKNGGEKCDFKPRSRQGKPQMKGHSRRAKETSAGLILLQKKSVGDVLRSGTTVGPGTSKTCRKWTALFSQVYKSSFKERSVACGLRFCSNSWLVA